jgi:hypothetical protein
MNTDKKNMAAESKLKSGASGYNIAIRPCGDEEGLCAIRIILKKTGKSSRLSAG